MDITLSRYFSITGPFEYDVLMEHSKTSAAREELRCQTQANSLRPRTFRKFQIFELSLYEGPSKLQIIGACGGSPAVDLLVLLSAFSQRSAEVKMRPRTHLARRATRISSHRCPSLRLFLLDFSEVSIKISLPLNRPALFTIRRSRHQQMQGWRKKTFYLPMRSRVIKRQMIAG